MDELRATYRLRVPEAELSSRVEELLLEQSAELPRAAIRDPFVEKEILPRTEGIEPAPEGAFDVAVVFPRLTHGDDPAQLLNVLFGNSSLQGDVELLSVSLPAGTAARLGGPRLGTPGLRDALGAKNGPLTCTALKPMGLSTQAIADLCAVFARAGIDVIKDDHGLANQETAPFEARLAACQRVVEEEKRRSGRCVVYAPNLIGTPEVVARQLDLARDRGVRAVLCSPMLLGLPFLQDLVRQADGVAVLAHPSFAGVRHISHPALFGTLMRAFGADAVIFPHAGGRFGFSEASCAAITRELREERNGLLPSLPVPAGGMTVERVEELVQGYGRDVMLLVGGSLYLAGPALEERAREFVDRVHRAGEALPEESA